MRCFRPKPEPKPSQSLYRDEMSISPSLFFYRARLRKQLSAYMTYVESQLVVVTHFVKYNRFVQSFIISVADMTHGTWEPDTFYFL